MVAARILNNITNEYVKEEGQVTFTTTKGDFAQPKVSFDNNGIAALQLTSEVSTSDVTAHITATVTSVPGATQYEGLSGQYQVKFVTEDSSGEIDKVAIINASSSQADRVNVEFNAPVTVQQIIDQYEATATLTQFEVAQAANFGFVLDKWDTAPLAGLANKAGLITNIEQVSSKVIRLILDTDDYFIQGTNGTTELRYDYLLGVGSNYDAVTDNDNVAFNGVFLRDNMTHNVSYTGNLDKILTDTDGKNFVLTDISQPWIKSVKAINQIELEVNFSEAMAEDIAEIVEGGTFKNFRVDGKKLMPIAGATSTTAERATATANNYLLVRDVYVNGYWELGKAVDKRNIVTIEIDPWNKLAPGEYSLQASNVGDWAAMTHQANMLETQTFDFKVDENIQIPTAKIDVHSPEQWLLTFDKPVKIKDTKQLKDAIKIYTKDEYAKSSPTALIMTDSTAPADHYQVTAVNREGELVVGPANGMDPTAGAVDVQRLLIEFKKDWTVEYNTANTNVNYFHSTKSPYVVVLDHWEHNITENSMEKTVLTAATPLDAKSPEIANAIDVYELENKTKRGVTVTETGKAVFVEMDEPVQLRNSGNTIVSTPLTESQKQAATGIPIPTFEFVKGDKVIPGSIAAGSIPQDDFDFVVEPDADLEPGEWTLIIRSISDDVGNTSATVTRKFVVKEGVKVNTDTRVSWIGFDNENTNYDYVYVKFTKEMKSTGEDGVARTTNYTLNNNPLPHGSEVIKGIKDWEGNATPDGNITNNWDGVTIKMPKTAWDGTDVSGSKDFTMVFGVASNFKAADNEALSGPYTVQLSHENGGSVADADFLFEALYLNSATAVTNLIAGEAVVRAEALDTDGDGKIDTIELYDQNNNKLVEASGHVINVNGVKFTSNGTDYVTTTPINTTASNGLKITSTTGAIIINTGNVVDSAAPVVKFKSSADKNNLVLEVSEKLKYNDGDDIKAHFDKSGTVVIDKAIYNKSANTITFTFSTAAANNDTIGVLATLEDEAGKTSAVATIAKITDITAAWTAN